MRAAQFPAVPSTRPERSISCATQRRASLVSVMLAAAAWGAGVSVVSVIASPRAPAERAGGPPLRRAACRSRTMWRLRSSVQHLGVDEIRRPSAGEELGEPVGDQLRMTGL